MAKNPVNGQPLSFVEIVMRADAETIKAAYEARIKVDGLLAEREEAYRKIAALEQQVDEIIGEPGVFVFPEPPMPVSGIGAKLAPIFPKKPASSAPKASEKTPAAESESESESEKK